MMQERVKRTVNYRANIAFYAGFYIPQECAAGGGPAHEGGTLRDREARASYPHGVQS